MKHLLVILSLIVLSQALLHEDTFLPAIHSGGKWFIFFSVPWCNSCQQVQKEWREFSKDANNFDFHVERVDCVQDAGLCRLADIERFPSFRLYHGGKQYDYTDTTRKSASWKKFIEGDYSKTTDPLDMPPVNARIPSEDDFLRAIEIILDYAETHIIISFGVVAVFFFAIGCCLGSILDAMGNYKPARKLKQK